MFDRLAGNAAKIVFPAAVFSVPGARETVYLTFDDGPVANVTPQILDILKAKEVKATFFCLGENVKKNPAIFERIIKEGHRLGLHGYKHLNGYKTGRHAYLQNVIKGSEWIASDLFRPPYGRITPKQYQLLKDRYRIVFWSLMSYDYHSQNTLEKCLDNLKKKTKAGDIVVFHDNEKVRLNSVSLLSDYIDFCRAQNFFFGVID
ncbi:MAG: polysaccharide deacetylase family protein [Bacteroidetes bacterium HGW-Bacteroidetes-21]|jgi:peptidoglycan/xylan/chitin deacetylase (PgdA/CDA1 family)|nr:MAG: polysaccharide deacetylase family protein [Bacteroidetes bacterium HGW-Bacteroidetes-21]